MSGKDDDHTQYYIWFIALIVVSYLVVREKHENIDRCIARGLSASLCKDHYDP